MSKTSPYPDTWVLLLAQHLSAQLVRPSGDCMFVPNAGVLLCEHVSQILGFQACLGGTCPRCLGPLCACTSCMGICLGPLRSLAHAHVRTRCLVSVHVRSSVLNAWILLCVPACLGCLGPAHACVSVPEACVLCVCTHVCPGHLGPLVHFSVPMCTCPGCLGSLCLYMQASVRFVVWMSWFTTCVDVCPGCLILSCIRFHMCMGIWPRCLGSLSCVLWVPGFFFFFVPDTWVPYMCGHLSQALGFCVYVCMPWMPGFYVWAGIWPRPWVLCHLSAGSVFTLSMTKYLGVGLKPMALGLGGGGAHGGRSPGFVFPAVSLSTLSRRLCLSRLSAQYGLVNKGLLQKALSRHFAGGGSHWGQGVPTPSSLCRGPLVAPLIAPGWKRSQAFWVLAPNHQGLYSL